MNTVLIPLYVWVIAQGYKYFTRSAKQYNYDLRNFVGDGGMPSSHTAIVSSLTTVTALAYGPASGAFTISLIFSLIIIHDALNVRAIVGLHSHLLNYLRSKLSPEEQKKFFLSPEGVGHTLPEVIGGLALGIFGSIALFYLIR